MSRPAVDDDLARRARRVSFVLMDVDGVLTDGRIHMLPDGTDTRSFHTHDGHGIRMGQRGGLEFGILSGREAEAVTARARELDIVEVHQRILRKVECFEEILSRRGLDGAAVCYIGDDLVDVPVMRRAGLAVATANAVSEAIEAAHYVTRLEGGRGAVREVVDLLLKARGTWPQVTSRYFE